MLIMYSEIVLYTFRNILKRKKLNSLNLFNRSLYIDLIWHSTGHSILCEGIDRVSIQVLESAIVPKPTLCYRSNAAVLSLRSTCDVQHYKLLISLSSQTVSLTLKGNSSLPLMQDIQTHLLDLKEMIQKEKNCVISPSSVLSFYICREQNQIHVICMQSIKWTFSALIIFCPLPSLPTLAQEPLRSYQVLLFLFHLDHMTSPGDPTTDFSFFCTLFFQYAWFDSWPLKHFACFSTSNVSLFEFQESICHTYFLSLFFIAVLEVSH